VTRVMMLALALASYASGIAAQEECLMSGARYADQQGGFVVQFHARTESTDASFSNVFTMIIPDNGLELHGYVTWNLGISRPNANIPHQCPEQPTYDEQRECSVWEGVIYVFDPASFLLPMEDEQAPDHILFPDLTRAFFHDQWALKLDTRSLPGEVFSLVGCDG
jgi:hypothetical protein